MHDVVRPSKTAAIMELTAGYDAYADAAEFSLPAESEAPAATPVTILILGGVATSYVISGIARKAWDRTFIFGC
ncbi:LxmA leader domain family RiPP [Nonomuraea sp. M3C6]|uniref:LxmA leader domain family RiPP n=1 Tax=Nonomuraea marmarensis TaxID=3351344 RepID=A0ABW7A9V1_9ACTN